MMQSTFHLLLALALGLFVAALVLSESRRAPNWPAPPAMLGSAMLWLLGSIQASSIQVATSGGTTTVAEPTIGIVAGIMSVLAFLLALLLAILWFPAAAATDPTTRPR